MCLRRGFVNYVIVGPSLDVQRLHFALRQAAHAKTAAREHDELRSKWERANAVFDELLALQRTANAIAQQARTEAAASPQVLSGALDQILEKVRATADSGRRARAPDGMSILIVDDDPLLRDICTTYLEDEGHRVLEAGDAEQCLDALERDRVDLILMDVMMPGVDGIAAIRKVRAIDRYRAIPIVMLTGHSDPETVKTCRAAGAVDFVVKPVDQKKLCEKIHKHAPTAIGGTADRSGHRAAGALARNRALPSWVKT
jgi:CheY-like chemotaxis protein